MSDSDLKKIEELEALAKDILEQRKASKKRRPIVIEFCGTPKAGKTSCLSALNLFLKRNGFKTRLVTERASICPVGDKFSPLFNIWTSNSAIAQLADYVAGSWRNLDVIICDRGIFDALCWFYWQKDSQYMSDEEHKVLSKYLTMDRFRSLIDIVYVFKVSEKSALEREYKNLLTRKSGTIMNHRVIEAFNKSLDFAVKKYDRDFRKIEQIDTSCIDQNQVGYKVTRQILQTLSDLTEENIAYLDRKDVIQFENRDIWKSEDWPERNFLKLKYEKRTTVEDDETKIQPLPIVILFDPNNRSVLVAKKHQKGVSKGSPESGKVVTYFGGHVRDDDEFAAGSDANFDRTCHYALTRELYEELGVTLNPLISNPLFIWLKNNPRSMKHLAVACVFYTDLDNLRIRLSPDEFVQRSGNSESGKIINIEKLEDSKFEDWSRICLRELLGIDRSEEFTFYRLDTD
ncbi:hypothetical protein GCM10023212_23200 [Luteolibacter yonseiensis]